MCAAMVEAQEVTERFTPGDLRRTIETRLTAAGVTSDTLKHLLSHGFGGVQDRHYQRSRYSSNSCITFANSWMEATPCSLA